MKTLIEWLNLWVDKGCPVCQQAIEALENRRGDVRLQVKLDISHVRAHGMPPQIHIELIEEEK